MFYDNLKAACEKKGVKITNLTDELKISRGNISKWKAGGSPKGDTLIKFADYFECSVDYLLGYTPKQTVSAPELSNDKSGLSKNEQKCLNIFNKLNEYDKIAFIARMEQRVEDYAVDNNDQSVIDIKKIAQHSSNFMKTSVTENTDTE